MTVNYTNSHHVLSHVLLSPLWHTRHIDAAAPIGSYSIVLGHHLRVLPHGGHTRALVKTESAYKAEKDVIIHGRLQPWRASY